MNMAPQESAPPADGQAAHTEGERFTAATEVTWIAPEPIGAGEFIMPVTLSSETARAFAALHLVLKDITFAGEALARADALGIPSDQDIQAKSLIFAAVVAYARPFKSGVRIERLDPADLAAQMEDFDTEIHEYLIALRDKHIAHAVNDFEGCEAVALVVAKPGEKWRDASGVGVVIKQTVGMSRKLVQQAALHIDALKKHIAADLEARRLVVYAEFQADFAQGKQLHAAPLLTLSDRSNVAKRRT